MGYTKDELLARLQEMHVDFASYSHPPVLTVEAQAKYVGHLGVGLSKNLLLKDKKHRYYIISALAGTNVDLKVLSQRLGLGKGGLRMAPEDALQELLQVQPGCVTPFALLNDSARSVSLLLDGGFKAQERCLFHPLSNDMTISLSASNLDKFLLSIGRKSYYVDLEANPIVGKDNPPDLADFAPSEIPSSLLEQTGKEAPVVSNQKSAPLEKQTNVPRDNKQPKISKCRSKKPTTTSSVLAEATDVKKFINELIDKTSTAVLSEITKEQIAQSGESLKSSVLEVVKRRITSDLENLAMILKNAAYTQGFQAGIQSSSLRR
ncbi:senataxin [Apostasia shenzhenica]|uniref:Senataxin n=1 Tax=Apostasia shenzhenica TaxID=1088818 RepID=A0A2H9ZW90_9ASPA|nr:senataxin [Apostasia shenzhenica]